VQVLSAELTSYVLSAELTSYGIAELSSHENGRAAELTSEKLLRGVVRARATNAGKAPSGGAAALTS